MPTFAEWLQQLSPTSFQDAGGKALFSTIGMQLDRGVDRMKQATRARFPESGPSDALDVLGIERQLPRAPSESDGAYGSYLRDAWDAWGGDATLGGGAGTPAGIIRAVERAGFPVTYSSSLSGDGGATSIVSWTGRWAQLYSDKLTRLSGFLDAVATRPIVDAFLPTDLGVTLKLWIKADAGLSQSSGNVTAIADQSGHGLDVTATGTIPYSATVMNGRPGWTNSAGTYLDNVSASPLTPASARTVFVVASPTTGGPLFESRRIGGSTFDVFAATSGYGAFPNGVFTDSANAANNASLATAIAVAPHIYEFSAAALPAQVAMKVDGRAQTVLQGSGVCPVETATTQGFRIGYFTIGASSFAGVISEVIVCDSQLSEADASKVRNYLAQKYQLWSLYPGWSDEQMVSSGAPFTSKFWLLLFAPDSSIQGLTNDVGNPRKALLNSTVEQWSSARSTYGGCWVIANPTWQSAVPGSPASRDIRFNDKFLYRLTGPQYPVLGWPPSSIDAVGGLLGDQNYIGGPAPLFIGPT